MSKTNRKLNDHDVEKAVKKAAPASANPQRKFSETDIWGTLRESGWACIRDESRDGVMTRTAFSPRTGKLVRFGNLRGCGSFDEAIAALGRFPTCTGVAFMYTHRLLYSHLFISGGWVVPENIRKVERSLDRLEFSLNKLFERDAQ